MTLNEIAEQLKNTGKDVELIYAFNGSGKTRLSRKFKQLIEPKNVDPDGDGIAERSDTKILYYNAFTEDLFYWDNDLELDTDPKLKIQPNKFTDWILKDQGQDLNIITNFQHYTNQKLTPQFNEEYKTRDHNDYEITTRAFSEVKFSFEKGDDEHSGNLKISKSEESNFIWSIFFTLLMQVVNILNVPDPEDRETDQFNHLEYVFIDDPVTSLDENHLIELAFDLAKLINDSVSNLKFSITTHNPLFYNVLYNELVHYKKKGKKRKKVGCYMLQCLEGGTYNLDEKHGHSNRSFSYHLYLKQVLEQAIEENRIEKYHFSLLRNLYEKTASFLGHKHWSDLLPKDGKEGYYKRITEFSNHNTLSNEEVAEPTEPEKQIIVHLLNNLIQHSRYCQQEEQYG